MSDWWRAVEDALGRLGDEGPDPWADVSVPEEATELTAEQPGLITSVALVEVIWVLERCYNTSQQDLINVLKQLLRTQQIRVDNDAVVRQTLRDFEFLIIDDASVDGSADVAGSLAAEDSRIQVIRHRTNRGHIATYNEGLGQAEGTYCVLLSADDLLTPGSLGRATAVRGSRHDASGVPIPLVVLTTSAPKRKSEGDKALRAAGVDTVFDVIELLTVEGRERLARYAKGGCVDAPLAGFWTERDIAAAYG